MVLEICIDSIESVKNAVNGGANRLEICSSLSEGGLTPTLGLINFTKQYTNIPIYSMIRIRSGNFNYTQEEIDAMIYDLKLLKNHNVDGFVFAARPKPVTFHRAFDEVDEPFIALNEIINLGFERILTSGKKNTAIEGIELIKQLVEKADDKIIIMPGSGITCDNISLIKNSTGAKEFHASAKIT
ncbi:copper homeostasis protein cutC homolog [Aphidius gifuensis]|uniref:copper homeostasis protein cutC homolog n=1 Tax=Aphidius gifuensis TaxID=684658 RepID=UPI001CDC60AE|nr:copper homeostasis protein cutC homolog [Aphidius gifuensis]